jgi:hypothetical protein
MCNALIVSISVLFLFQINSASPLVILIFVCLLAPFALCKCLSYVILVGQGIYLKDSDFTAVFFPTDEFVRDKKKISIQNVLNENSKSDEISNNNNNNNNSDPSNLNHDQLLYESDKSDSDDRNDSDDSDSQNNNDNKPTTKMLYSTDFVNSKAQSSIVTITVDKHYDEDDDSDESDSNYSDYNNYNTEKPANDIFHSTDLANNKHRSPVLTLVFDKRDDASEDSDDDSAIIDNYNVVSHPPENISIMINNNNSIWGSENVFNNLDTITSTIVKTDNCNNLEYTTTSTDNDNNITESMLVDETVHENNLLDDLVPMELEQQTSWA